VSADAYVPDDTAALLAGVSTTETPAPADEAKPQQGQQRTRGENVPNLAPMLKFLPDTEYPRGSCPLPLREAREALTREEEARIKRAACVRRFIQNGVTQKHAEELHRVFRDTQFAYDNLRQGSANRPA
jgi:hypothetical protein